MYEIEDLKERLEPHAGCELSKGGVAGILREIVEILEKLDARIEKLEYPHTQLFKREIDD